MRMRFKPSATLSVAMFAVLFLLAACEGTSTLAPTPTVTPIPVPTSTTSALTPTPTPIPTLTATPSPYTGYLAEEIPPCTPAPGSSVDPCDPDAPPMEMGIAESLPELGDEPSGVREMLEDGLSPPARVTHLALRGTYLPGTVRCTSGDLFRRPSYLGDEFGFEVDSRSFKCYVDVRSNAYILGSGPSILTILFFYYIYWDGDYALDTEEGQTEQDVIEEVRRRFEALFGDLLSGREHVAFLGPNVDLSSEAWRLLGYWDVQRQEDGTVMAVHPHRDLWRRLRPDDYQTYRSVLEMELAAFTQAVKAANQARVTQYEGRIGADEGLPMLVTDANQLRQYYTAVGAYYHPDGPPVQPPPPCGLAVADQTDNPGLMGDCMALLAARDTLRGTATLNWSVDTAIADWDGVTVSSTTPKNVTGLDLSEESLTGSIPAELGDLRELQTLDLSDNSLTGEIPAELGKRSWGI